MSTPELRERASGIRALAATLGVHESTARKYAAEGCPLSDHEARAWISDNYPDTGNGGARAGAGRPRGSGKAARQPKGKPNARASFREAQAERLGVQTELQRIELERAKGELVPIAEVRRALHEYVAQWRQRIEQLPSEISAKVAELAVGRIAEPHDLARQAASSEIARLMDDLSRIDMRQVGTKSPK